MNTRGTVTTTIQPTRLTPDERGTVTKAAALVGTSLSDLMRAGALEYAVRVINQKDK